MWKKMADIRKRKRVEFVIRLKHVKKTNINLSLVDSTKRHMQWWSIPRIQK